MELLRCNASHPQSHLQAGSVQAKAGGVCSFPATDQGDPKNNVQLFNRPAVDVIINSLYCISVNTLCCNVDYIDLSENIGVDMHHKHKETFK